MAERAVDWPWSSVHAHLGSAADDGLTATAPVRERWPDFAVLIAVGEDEERSPRLRRAEMIGRPLGSEAFLEQLERAAGRTLNPGKPGPVPGEKAES